MDSNEIIAPFVCKTYHMVNDPSLDGFIRWGIGNNSFIVVEPLGFSQRLLPAYFKHNNFSSFVRQLNTYGFRKVDPDRWEFASEWFLRGQTHLLKNLGRKKQVMNQNRSNFTQIEEDDEVDEQNMAMEIERLKQDQKALEQELIGMNKRLEATERRPDQMMALLHKVAEDPQILPRMVTDRNQRSKRLMDRKRQRILIPPSESPENCYNCFGNGNDVFWQSSASPPPETPSMPWTGTISAAAGTDFHSESELLSGITRYGNVEFAGGFSTEADGKPSPAYPFSLLGGGF